MTAYLLPGICGLFLGLALQWTGFHQPSGLRDTFALRRSYALRSGLYALGASMVLTALLCWLAVIDVDDIEVLPLHIGTILGGVIFGVAAGLTGFTPGTAFAGLGGGPVLTALSIIAGCVLGAMTLPFLTEAFTALREAGPSSAATLFQVTLDEPFLLDGGFLGQGCAGLLLVALAMCIPSPRLESPEKSPDAPPVLLLPAPAEAKVTAVPEDGESPAEASPEEPSDEETPDESIGEEMPETDPDPLPEEPAPEAPSDEPAPKATERPRPEDLPADTFVALLPGEEPLVVDTSAEEKKLLEPTPSSNVPGDDSGEGSAGK